MHAAMSLHALVSPGIGKQLRALLWWQITRISDLEAQHAKLLTQLPKAIQDKYWQRHKDASSVPGTNAQL